MRKFNSYVLKYFNSIIDTLFDGRMWDFDVSGICNVRVTHVYGKYLKHYNKQEDAFMNED